MDLEYYIPEKSKGGYLLRHQARLLGIREHWHFGLWFTDTKGRPDLLESGKAVSKSRVKPTVPMNFEFRPTFFPEKLDELVETSTVREFYYFVKGRVESGNLECPDPDHKKELTGLAAVVDDLLEDRAPMLKYLASASRLETYGMELFQVHEVQPGADGQRLPVWLGIHAKGITTYARSDQQKPLTVFLWATITKEEVYGSNLIVTATGESNVTYKTTDAREAKLIQRLCQGHRKMIRPRSDGDNLLITQMKAQLNRQEIKDKWFQDRILQLQKNLESLKSVSR